ncbi:S9 family peptidase [Fervidibacillus halotolerans]|uniref:S9 family peptidase n=1 Tax=Fervidibacillus halotolerans TaxID=2980027 RepID=A0A9E8M060_9BACI|nr:S9 family peptidase [Fervidibacillus halotolerans]WAA12955.1 S9 family peptidase [Fervidibacillus halotolerans]
MIQFSKPDVEQFFRTLNVQDFVVRNDEKQLVLSTNLNGNYNLWAMDLPNEFPYPLTFHNQPCQALYYEKKGRFIVAGFDRDGDENTQLYAIPPYGGELVPLRVKENERHFFIHLSEDGKRLYYTGTKGNPTYLNSYLYNIETGDETRLLEGKEVPTFIAAVSPDEQSFTFVKQFGNTSSLGYVQTGGKHYLITPQEDLQQIVSDIVYTSETEIYFLTNYDADLCYLAKFNVETKQFEKILEIEKEDLRTIKYDKKNRLLYLIGSYGVEDRLYAFDLNTKKTTEILLPTSVVEKIIVAESGNLYVLGRSAIRPNNIFHSTDQGNSWKELTHFRIPGVADEQLVEPEVFTYPSYDGLEIEALFFQAKPENSNDHVILWPHGGPQSLERKWFRSLFQFLVNRGYSIFAPNFRGSSNYGLSFMKMVERNWGHGPRLDNVAGLEFLIEKGYAKRDKILLMGGSYGGYMALLLHGRHAEYFKAVVDIFGVSNLFSFIETVPEFWKPFMDQWVGHPEKDKELLKEHSPITYLDGMTKPMLVIQGANDPRVVKAESDQIVEALRKKGRRVDYIVLEDEGHGFSKKENEIKVYRKILHFFDEMIN